MDKERFQLTAKWLAELMNEPKFKKSAFVRYVTKLAKESRVRNVEYEYPPEVEDQNEDLIKL